MRTRNLILACLCTLSSLAQAQTFEQRAVGEGMLPPIDKTYKSQILSWSRRYYEDPRAAGPAALSDPVLIRDGTGRLLWLVCLEVANPPSPAVTGVPDRLAFGFAPSYFSAPHERYRSTIIRADCDAAALAYRPFREFTLGESRPAAAPKRRAPLASR